jgi:hypothetical protein
MRVLKKALNSDEEERKKERKKGTKEPSSCKGRKEVRTLGS